MQKCDKCDSTHIEIVTVYKYHNLYECLTCGYWTYKRIDNCCRSPFDLVSIQHYDFTHFSLFKQCTNCGGSINRTKPLSAKLYGDQIKANFSNESFSQWTSEINEEKKLLAENKKFYNYYNSKYYQYQCYLSSDQWKAKRKLVLSRDNNLCQHCKDKPADEVHHLTYVNLFNEPIEDLLSLCRNCHITIHDKTLPEFQEKGSH